MNRKSFLKNCGMACLVGLPGASVLLSGCGSVRRFNAPVLGSDLVVPLSEFLLDPEKTPPAHRSYLLVENEKLRFPICVYRLSETEFSAIYLQCSHQGNEVQAFGDRLQCPAHGSEFDKNGQVKNGPAAKPLRRLPATVAAGQLMISLK